MLSTSFCLHHPCLHHRSMYDGGLPVGKIAVAEFSPFHVTSLFCYGLYRLNTRIIFLSSAVGWIRTLEFMKEAVTIRVNTPDRTSLSFFLSFLSLCSISSYFSRLVYLEKDVRFLSYRWCACGFRTLKIKLRNISNRSIGEQWHWYKKCSPYQDVSEKFLVRFLAVVVSEISPNYGWPFIK